MGKMYILFSVQYFTPTSSIVARDGEAIQLYVRDQAISGAVGNSAKPAWRAARCAPQKWGVRGKCATRK